jgi:hypothetical protein
MGGWARLIDGNVDRKIKYSYLIFRYFILKNKLGRAGIKKRRI